MTNGKPAYLIASSFMPEGRALDDHAHASSPLWFVSPAQGTTERIGFNPKGGQARNR